MDWKFFSPGLQRIRQSQLRGPKRVTINYWWLPTIWKSGGRRHQMCGRGLSLPSQKQCSNLAVMHFCLIDCFDAVFFFSPILFLREHGCHPPLTSLDEENLVGFQLHPARTFRRSFDGKKSHWRPQGPHWPPFIYQHITLHFWFLARNEWGGKVTCEWHTVCTWTYVLYEVCVSAGWCFYFVCEAAMKGGAQGPTNHMRGPLICIINCWH